MNEDMEMKFCQSCGTPLNDQVPGTKAMLALLQRDH